MKFSLGRYQFGFTHDTIFNQDQAYLERWILWCGITLRVHRFLASDPDRAIHDHPWWFITLPFGRYGEFIEAEGAEGEEVYRTVAPWRPHFRPAHFRHRVEITRTPSWTLVITGPKSNEWGFWQRKEQGQEFVHNRDWERLN